MSEKMKRVNNLTESDIGKYAIFRRSNSGSRAHFTMLRPDLESAETEAVRLVASSLQANPDGPELFFIMRLEAYIGFDKEFIKGPE